MVLELTSYLTVSVVHLITRAIQFRKWLSLLSENSCKLSILPSYQRVTCNTILISVDAVCFVVKFAKSGEFGTLKRGSYSSGHFIRNL